jgi:hypothetical protein
MLLFQMLSESIVTYHVFFVIRKVRMHPGVTVENSKGQKVNFSS